MPTTRPLILLPLLLFGCKSAPKSKTPPLPPRVTVTPVKPASITIDSSTGWSGAPTNGGMPLYTDDDTAIRFFPRALIGTIIIQRSASDVGYLNGKVTVPVDAVLYAAFAYQTNQDRLISDQQFAAMEAEGWTRVPGIFQVTESILQETQFQVMAHFVPAGPVTVTSQTLPNPAALFLGRPH
jgi:hypothetical protein